MSIATTRAAAMLTNAAHCALCGAQRNTTIIQLPGLTIDLRAHRAYAAGSELKLTVREFELLHLLAERAGDTITKLQLYRDLWNLPSVPHYTRSLDAHVSRLRRKLTVLPQSTARIETVWGVGWRLLA